MCRYGAACAGNQNLLKGSGLCHKGFNLFDKLGVTACVGNENSAKVDIRLVGKSFLNVFLKGHRVLSAILLANPHGSVSNLDTRLKL